MPKYKPNLLLGQPDAMDLAPSPAAVLRKGASPALRAAFEYITTKYPRILRSVPEVVPATTEAAKKAFAGSVHNSENIFGWYDPTSKNIHILDRFTASNPTQVSNYINTLAHETMHHAQKQYPRLTQPGRKIPYQEPFIQTSYERVNWPSEYQAFRKGDTEMRNFLTGLSNMDYGHKEYLQGLKSWLLKYIGGK